MPWYQNTKTGITWIWVKGKWFVVTAALLLFGSGVVNQILQEDPILQEHLLKVPQEKILLSQEVDRIVEQPNGKFKKVGREIKYRYISNEVVEQATRGELREDVSKRTTSIQFFKKGIVVKDGQEKEEWVSNFYAAAVNNEGVLVGPFWKDVDGKWYRTKMATTSPEAFERQTKISWRNKTLGIKTALAIATTIDTGAGDGYITYAGGASWSVAHDRFTGTNAYPTATIISIGGFYNAPEVAYRRGYISIATQGLPDDADISSTTFYGYVILTLNDDNDGNNWGTVAEANQASVATLATADYAQCGESLANGWGNASSTDIIEGTDERKDITDLALGLNAWHGWDLNAIGRGWIDKTGDTKLCLREGHDMLNHDPADLTDGQGTGFRIDSFEGTNPAYLSIVYSVTGAAAVSAPISDPQIF